MRSLNLLQRPVYIYTYHDTILWRWEANVFDLYVSPSSFFVNTVTWKQLDKAVHSTFTDEFSVFLPRDAL